MLTVALSWTAVNTNFTPRYADLTCRPGLWLIMTNVDRNMASSETIMVSGEKRLKDVEEIEEDRGRESRHTVDLIPGAQPLKVLSPELSRRDQTKINSGPNATSTITRGTGWHGESDRPGPVGRARG